MTRAFLDSLDSPSLSWAIRAWPPPAAAALAGALVAAAPELAWRQTYALQDIGADFLDSYGWTELLGRDGPVPSERLACGLLLLALYCWRGDLARKARLDRRAPAR